MDWITIANLVASGLALVMAARKNSGQPPLINPGPNRPVMSKLLDMAREWLSTFAPKQPQPSFTPTPTPLLPEAPSGWLDGINGIIAWIKQSPARTQLAVMLLRWALHQMDAPTPEPAEQPKPA